MIVLYPQIQACTCRWRAHQARQQVLWHLLLVLALPHRWRQVHCPMSRIWSRWSFIHAFAIFKILSLFLF